MIPVVHEYNVVPKLPEALQQLKELAYNLHWSWHHDIIAAFRRLDRELWETSFHNPVLMLGSMSQERLEAMAHDEAYLSFVDRVYRQHLEHLQLTSWYQREHGSRQNTTIAYFSAEFGITECLAIYSGGLGVLSGDHLKSSSELGIPLVGVGLAYQQGFFSQYLNADGWQQERYPHNDFFNLPAVLERHGDGSLKIVEVDYPGSVVKAQIWRVQVGRVPLYLLDTNIAANSEGDQTITGQLYGGDREMRIRQEIMLGIGGLRALRLLGVQPTVCHMNEGHSAFQALERIGMVREESGLAFAEAKELCMAGNVFTTHTPVPAGFDLFSHELMDKYFAKYVGRLGISMAELMAMGRMDPKNGDEMFNMAMLAIRHSSFINGVSKLHGEVSRALVNVSLPKVPENEIAVTHVTNGTHTRSWISFEMTELLTRYLGRRWLTAPADQSVWQRVNQIPDAELWRTHERRRERLVALVRAKLHRQLLQRGASVASAAAADEVLDPEALTIGFARRFATYKRATLLLKDVERLRKIILDSSRPVQFIFAGKAHPHDHAGKELIRQLVHAGLDAEIHRRMVFLENYDIGLARYLVQGVDVWLNNPRRPNEASGTSGMKVVFNGGLNLSILDGWWCEGYDPSVGWAIGQGEQYQDHEHQDRVESEALYTLLEEEVVPTFYNRGRDGLPRDWIRMMKASMRELGPVFNTNRMVHEYASRFYLPADSRFVAMKQDGATRARQLASYKATIHQKWSEVQIVEVSSEGNTDAHVGNSIKVSAKLRLGSLSPEHVAVQVFDGALNVNLKISTGDALPMQWERKIEDGLHAYVGTIPCRHSGHRGFTLRVIPNHADLSEPLMLGLVCWE
ncbi:MAG: alpha-glucan phosphorylase [Deltaproteobacteria bacterium RIFOXYA12_FULL_58_15]|nr:MAG: alpha-glucan phosphorylase [Deltaproteobacteria bacterium RIFOXYA12_FULL_58_15]OGR08172.1 MAG: alpha-glucan phosphorylase [Deltaproteobacteria bacterium RIFOXYB12_FULL_58_9]